MRRVTRLVVTVVPVVALAACASPTAPVSFDNCPSGKVPYATCANRDYINPVGDYINPVGDYINPVGRDTVRTSE